MANARHIASWVLAVLGGLLFIFAGYSKAAATPQLEMIHEAIGAPLWMLRAIGVVEIVGGIALFVPKTRFYAAAMLFGVVLVAFVWHMVVGDFAGAPASVVAATLMGVLAWLDRPAWVQNKFF